MPHCTKCGAAIADNAAFCPACGAGQTQHNPGASPASSQSGLQENVAGALCYVLGWITGLIFFFVDKRPYVLCVMTTYLRRERDGEEAISTISLAAWRMFDRLARASEYGRVVSTANTSR